MCTDIARIASGNDPKRTLNTFGGGLSYVCAGLLGTECEQLETTFVLNEKVEVTSFHWRAA